MKKSAFFCKLSVFFFIAFLLVLGSQNVNAAITLVDSQSGGAENGGNVTLTFGETLQQGDVVIFYGGYGYQGSTSLGPITSGYSEITSHTGSDPMFGAWYKVMTSSPDTQVQGYGTGDMHDGTAYGCFVLRGVDSSLFDNTATTSGPTTSTNPDPPAIGVTTSGSWVLAVAGSVVYDITVTAPTNYINLEGNGGDDTGSGSKDFSTHGVTREMSSTGSENPGSFGSWNSGIWYAITMAIKAATIPSVTLGGTIYQSDESSPYQCATSGSLTVSVVVNNGSTLSGTCIADTGAWSIPSVSITSGQTAVAYLNGGSVRGSTVLVSDATAKSDIPIIQDDVVVRDDVNGTITNSEISMGNTSDSDDLISFSGSDITVDPSYEIHIYTGDTYAPGANVSTGSLHMVGNYTGTTETITLTGTSGTLMTRSGTFTQGTTDVRVASASGTPSLLSAATTFHKLTITSPATVINANQAITLNSADNSALIITTGVLNDSGYGITGPGAGTGRTLTIGSGGSLCLGGAATNTSATCNSNATSTTAREMPSFNTYTFDSASTVYFLSDAATSVSSTPTYGNLYFNPTLTTDRTYTFSGAVTINGDFTSNPTAASSYTLKTNLGGTTTVASTKTLTLSGTTSGKSELDTVSGNDYSLSVGVIDIQGGGTLNAQSSTITLTGTSGTKFTRLGTFDNGNSTVVFNQSSGDITLNSGTITFNSLQINLSGRTGTLGNTITVEDDLAITAGTLADGGYQITGNGTGALSMASGSTLRLGSASTATTFPTSYANGNCSLDSASTVTYFAGVNQTVSEVPTYGNLNLGPTLAADRVYTFGGATTINGDLDITPSAASGYRLTVNLGGTTSVASTKDTIINGATAVSTLNTTESDYSLSTGDIVIAGPGTFTANDSEVTIYGSWTLSSGGTFNYDTSNVIFAGADSSTQTLIGVSTTFYDFTASTATNSAGRTIAFTGGSTYTVTGTWNITGYLGKVITLQSTIPSNWTIDPTAAVVTYVDVYDSTNTGCEFCATFSTVDAETVGWDASETDSCDEEPPEPSADSNPKIQGDTVIKSNIKFQ